MVISNELFEIFLLIIAVLIVGSSSLEITIPLEITPKSHSLPFTDPDIFIEEYEASVIEGVDKLGVVSHTSSLEQDTTNKTDKSRISFRTL